MNWFFVTSDFCMISVDLLMKFELHFFDKNRHVLIFIRFEIDRPGMSVPIFFSRFWKSLEMSIELLHFHWTWDVLPKMIGFTITVLFALELMLSKCNFALFWRHFERMEFLFSERYSAWTVAGTLPDTKSAFSLCNFEGNRVKLLDREEYVQNKKRRKKVGKLDWRNRVQLKNLSFKNVERHRGELSFFRWLDLTEILWR